MQIKQHTNHNRTWMYIGVFAVLLFVLIILLLNNKNTQVLPDTITTLVRTLQNENNPQRNRKVQTPTSTTPAYGRSSTQTETESTAEGSLSQEENQQSEQDRSSTRGTGGGAEPQLVCVAERGELCTIKSTDQIYAALGYEPDQELMVGGVRIKPQKITYQISSGTYNDEQIQDAAGKVLTSTSKKYDEQTRILSIIIGANPDYYRNLTTAQQKTLYMSQTVRAFMTMFGETPDNFVKVERAVGNLGSWHPTP